MTAQNSMRLRGRSRRRGMGTVEWVFVAAAIILACVITIAAVGGNVRNDMDNTAVEVGDPAQLPMRFRAN